MKKLCNVVLSTMMTFATLQASTNSDVGSRNERYNNLISQLDENTDELEEVYNTGKSLTADYERLNATKELLDGAKANYLKQRNETMMDAQEVGLNIDAHNSRCPGGTSPDKAYVDGCNQEADQLNSKRAAVLSRRETIEQTRVDLVARYKDLSDATVEWVSKRKSNIGRYESLTQQRDRIIAELKALQTEVDSCKDALRRRGNGSNDYLKNQCGNAQFDGTNYNAPPPPPDPPSN